MAHRALRQAEESRAAGRRGQAVSLYVRAGAFHKAAQAAVEMGDERRAVDCSLRAALGRVPDRYAGAGALAAAELLAGSGHHSLAIGLFELAGAHRQAAESAMRLHRWPRAARFFETARLYVDAAACYERAGQLEAALRLLELESNRLRRNSRARPGDEVAGPLGVVEARRAETLCRLGRSTEAAELLRGVKPTPETVDLLVAAERYEAAIEACLRLGDGERAARLLRRAPDLDRRLLARVYLTFGRPLEAGNVFAGAGLAREAAEAYEAGGDWPKAASRWEAAGDHERAAQAYRQAGRPRDAARCFVAGGKPLEAAACCAQTGGHAAAAELYLKAGRLLTAASTLLAAGDRDGAARILLLLQPGDADFQEGALALIPLLLDEGLTEQALCRARLLTPRRQATARERFLVAALDLEARGKDTLAETIYRGVLELAPEDADARQRLHGLTARREAGAEPRTVKRPQASTPAPLNAPASAAAPLPAGAPATAAFPGVAVGQLLAGRYQLLGDLGRGGMGRVFKAHDQELGELVAIKTLLAPAAEDPVDAERMLREVQICRKITHPNVVRVFDLGRYAGGIFITMELLDGDRLDTLMSRESQLPLQRVKGILEEIGAGLEEAHANGIVHRDLKPGNIMLTSSRLKILDFGIARMIGVESRRLTRTGFALGSVLYIAPEQLQGAMVDGRADLYALGVLAYALVTGHTPFDGATAGAIVMQHLQQPPPDPRLLRPGLPAGWTELIHRLLAKLPADRPQSIRQVLDALAPLPVDPSCC